MFQYSKGERKGTLFSGGKMSLFSIKTICQSLSIDTVEFHLLTNHLFLYLCNNESQSMTKELKHLPMFI